MFTRAFLAESTPTKNRILTIQTRKKNVASWLRIKMEFVNGLLFFHVFREFKEVCAFKLIAQVVPVYCIKKFLIVGRC